MSDSLQSHGLQHARPPCPSPTPGVYPNSVHWVGDAIQPSHPLSSPSPPAFNLSQHQGLFKSRFLHIRWPKYWNFSFNISPSNEHPGLISFRTDWFWSPGSPRDSQESSPTPQFKSINSLAVSFLYSPTVTSIWLLEKPVLTRWTFVGKVMSLFFNMLSRLVIAFLPGSKHLLISWLQSPSAVVLVGIWAPMNYYNIAQWFSNVTAGKESTCNIGDVGLIPGLGRSPGGGNGNSLQYSCPGNTMDCGVWWAAVRGVTESDMTERVSTHSTVVKKRLAAPDCLVLPVPSSYKVT